MSTEGNTELTNARRKLRLLEESYEEALHDVDEGEEVHELELRTLKRLINELKEDIVRCQVRGHGRVTRRILSDVELENTRRKLAELQRCTRADARDTDGDPEQRAMSHESQGRLVNQMKEEIIWTEVHRNAHATVRP